MPLPHHYALPEFFKLLRDWLHGNTDKNDTYGQIRFLWLNRWGSIIQFFAGLSVIIEIIGKEKMRQRIEGIDALIRPNVLIQRMGNIFNYKSPFYQRWRVIRTLFFIGIISRFVNFLIDPRHQYESNPRPGVDTAITTGDKIFWFIILAVVVLIIVRATRPFMQWLIQLPIVLVLRIFYLLMMLSVEFIFFKPVILYLKISVDDRKSKILSFFSLMMGFCMSLLFS